ncbi:MAG: hypothetical protein EOO63_02170 [Hymenobacter sp.]|nr:MAG: hypothetical protein EOO63_02170 [Hymenobacter sp.]
MPVTIPLSLPAILLYITVVMSVVAGIIGLIRFRHLPTQLRYLAALTIFELPLEVAGLVIMLSKGNNLFLMPIYTIGELAFLALLYRQTLQLPAFSRVAPWVVAGFAVYALVDSLALGVSWYRPGQQIVQSLLILSMVWLYFRKLLSELQVRYLAREPIFWVSTGLLIYFLGYLQIALFSNYLLQHYSPEFNRNVWAVHTLLSIVLHLCYCVALWMRPQK